MGRSLRVFCLATSLLGGALTAGCVTTREEGDALRADVAQLQGEVARMQKERDDERGAEEERHQALLGRVSELEGVLASLRQADADGGVRLEAIIAELQTLRGEIEEARYQLGETKKSVQDILERPPVAVSAAVEAPKPDSPQTPTIAGSPVPEERQALYDFAKALYDEGKYAEALEAFEFFSRRHPDDELKDNVWFWTGEAHSGIARGSTDAAARAQAYKKAILSYQKVLEIPESNKGDGALYKIGLAFEALGFVDEAKVFYEEILAKYPKSPLLPQAKTRLVELSRTGKGAKKKRAR